MYLLGYIPKDSRLYLSDKDLNIVSYQLLLSVLEYQTAVMRRDFDSADKVLPTIPKDQRTRVAHFLEKQVRVEAFWDGREKGESGRTHVSSGVLLTRFLKFHICCRDSKSKRWPFRKIRSIDLIWPYIWAI